MTPPEREIRDTPRPQSAPPTFSPPYRQQVNQKRLRELRLARHVSARQVAKDCGLEVQTYNRLEVGKNPATTLLTLASMMRVADYFTVPIGDLFTEPADPEDHLATDPAADPRNDIETLGALLGSLEGRINIGAVADSLHWTQERTQSAIKALNLALKPCGLTVFRHNGRIAIQPLSDHHHAAQLRYRRHPRALLTQRVVTPARTKMLHKASLRPYNPGGNSQADKVNLAILVKAGLLVEVDKRRYAPSPDVLFSLNPIAHRTEIVD